MTWSIVARDAVAIFMAGRILRYKWRAVLGSNQWPLLGELRELRVSDFEGRRKALSIRQGKTGARTVPLSDAARAHFARLCRSKLPGAYAFTRDDGEPWKHSDQDEPMREAARAAKLPKGSVFYTMRHTFIASAITGGVDIHTVAKITGTSVRMIEQHYGKLLQDDARERLNRITFA